MRSGVIDELDLILEVQFGQSYPVQQHDLPLGLAEEAKDSLAVKV